MYIYVCVWVCIGVYVHRQRRHYRQDYSSVTTSCCLTDWHASLSSFPSSRPSTPLLLSLCFVICNSKWWRHRQPHWFIGNHCRKKVSIELQFSDNDVKAWSQCITDSWSWRTTSIRIFNILFWFLKFISASEPWFYVEFELYFFHKYHS